MKNNSTADFLNAKDFKQKVITNAIKRNIKYKEDLDGRIEFIDRSVSPIFLQSGQMSMFPEVGTMYIFPSNLLHTVYPFLGEGTRRSIAWNGVYSIENRNNEKKDNK